MAKRVLLQKLVVPLPGGGSAKIELDTGTGNLDIDSLSPQDPMLASGSLEYMEGQEPPEPYLNTGNGQASLSLQAKGGRRPSFRLPWSACNGATDWQIRLNPAVASDITARSGGGNLRLALSDLSITRLVADSGGGNMEIVLPSHAADLSVAARTGGGNISIDVGANTCGSNTMDARSGAGNVTVRLPARVAARIQASTGMGKVMVEPRFHALDRGTFQSADYETADDRIDLTLHSGAGNITVTAN